MAIVSIGSVRSCCTPVALYIYTCSHSRIGSPVGESDPHLWSFVSEKKGNITRTHHFLTSCFRNAPVPNPRYERCVRKNRPRLICCLYPYMQAHGRAHSNTHTNTHTPAAIWECARMHLLRISERGRRKIDLLFHLPPL